MPHRSPSEYISKVNCYAKKKEKRKENSYEKYMLPRIPNTNDSMLFRGGRLTIVMHSDLMQFCYKHRPIQEQIERERGEELNASYVCMHLSLLSA